MKDLDKSNILISVLHIRDASKLLEYDEPEISLSLLKLSKAIIDKNNLLSADISEAEKIVEEIKKD